jgi:hypothetical protein
MNFNFFKKRQEPKLGSRREKINFSFKPREDKDGRPIHLEWYESVQEYQSVSQSSRSKFFNFNLSSEKRMWVEIECKSVVENTVIPGF